jgi:hypothetical protein
MKEVPSTSLHCTTNEIAELFGISVQRVGQLRKAGILEKGEDGLYDLATSMHAYGTFIQSPHLFDRVP